MALIKTAEEIQAMREGGALLSRALEAAALAVRPGVTMREIDEIAERTIREGGGKPSFKGYKGGGKIPFPATLCVSKNEEVVHGIGTREIVLNEGDIVGLDIGCWYKDMCTDMAVTVPVGKISAKHLELIKVTRASMEAGVAAARPGGKVSEIAAGVEGAVNPKKYGIVKDLVGHGVGHAVHEPPNVPNYVSDNFPDVSVRPGMCLAIEPMLTLGTDEVQMARDGWTIVTADDTYSAHFEVTIAVLADRVEVVTPQPKIRGVDF